ncbi:hypothetical protein HZH68_007544 [Vespula germanica]|uniref:Uncharacterized protein n=1 Tax=Vespula germanica TaxID=30212 RepID=A0A834K752_VESGE|nr:hypothetical protein HZH68_007544 [Vespula germanica]
MENNLELPLKIEKLEWLISNVQQYGACSTSQTLPILICGSGVDTAEEEGSGEEEVPGGGLYLKGYPAVQSRQNRENSRKLVAAGRGKSSVSSENTFGGAFTPLLSLSWPSVYIA